MKKRFSIIVAALGLFFAPNLLSKYYEAKRINSAKQNVVKLTPVDNHKTGGTGFSFRAPSGKLFTLTNAHICRLSSDGRLSYTQDNVRYGVLQILEVNKKADLCILSSVPGTDGLSLGKSVKYFQQLFILGHPMLQGLTFSFGNRLNTIKADLLFDVNVSKEKCDDVSGSFVAIDDPLAKLFLGVNSYCIVSYKADRTTATIYPGNSGSPVLDEYGDVVGVVFAAYSETHAGLVVTFDDLLEFVKRY